MINVEHIIEIDRAFYGTSGAEYTQITVKNGKYAKIIPVKEKYEQIRKVIFSG